MQQLLLENNLFCTLSWPESKKNSERSLQTKSLPPGINFVPNNTTSPLKFYSDIVASKSKITICTGEQVEPVYFALWKRLHVSQTRERGSNDRSKVCNARKLACVHQDHPAGQMWNQSDFCVFKIGLEK